MEKAVLSAKRVPLNGGSKKEASIPYEDFMVALGVPSKVATNLANSGVCIFILGPNDKNQIAISDIRKAMDEGKIKASMFEDKAMLKKIQLK